MFYKNTKITKNREYLNFFYLCNRKQVLLDWAAQYYSLNLYIQVMKFLGLLMAPGFNFFMDESPSKNDTQWISSLFVFTPSSSTSHPYVISGNKIIILILQFIIIIWIIWKREKGNFYKVTRLKKNLFHIGRKYLQYQKMIFWPYQGPVFPGFLRHG